jgi:CheY-like chemotaxis protein
LPRLRVILVDDQPLILLALERMLRPMRKVWEVVATDSGRLAQERMEAAPFDVLVSDLNMPGYGGVELLDWTQAHAPATVRIVLSGHQNKAMIDGASRSAHRFLTKPCAPDHLLDTIQKTSALRSLPTGALDLRRAVAGMGQLPASPVTCHKLKTYVNNPNAPTTGLRELFLQDPGLAAKALHLVNSAFFGVPRPLVDPWEAALLLDREKLANLVMEPANPDLEHRLRPIREAHLLLAREALAAAQAEGASEAAQNLAYTAGLLSAAGPMIVAAAFPNHLQTFLEGGTGLGATGAELSWQYLNLLGLPAPLLDLVETHREQYCLGGDAIDLPSPKDQR